jgi:hypothetical protein
MAEDLFHHLLAPGGPDQRRSCLVCATTPTRSPSPSTMSTPEWCRKSVRPAESYAFKCTGAVASLSRFSRTRLGATSSPPPSLSSRPARMSCDRVQPLHAVANLFYQMVGRGTRSRNRQTNVRHLYDYTGASRKPLTLAHFECYSVLPTRSSPNELDRGSRRLGGN